MSKSKKVVVLGAGVTGLSAAYRMSRYPGFDVHVIEREGEPGGLCRSFSDGEFILDHGPHKFYSLVDGVVDELRKIMGESLLERDKTQSLYMCGKYFDYPLKMSEMVLRFPPLDTAKILASYALQIGKNLVAPKKSQTYEDYIVKAFGRGLFQQIFEPMAQKIYGDPRKLDQKLAEVRLPSKGLISVVKQMLFSKKIDRTLSAPKFHYPKLGYGEIPATLARRSIENGVEIHLNCKLLNIQTRQGQVSGVTYEGRTGQRETIECDYLIYSIPISTIGNLMDGLADDYRRASELISFRHTVIYYFLLKSQPVLPSMWVFFPESHFRFGRLSEMHKFSPYTCPKGHTALMVDFTCDEDDPYWSMDDKELGAQLQRQLEVLQLFEPHQVQKRFSRRFRNFYPIYHVGYQENLSKIRELEMKFENLFFIGRLGDFNYNNADQCLDMGFLAADHIHQEGKVGPQWNHIRQNRFENYRIVD